MATHKVNIKVGSQGAKKAAKDLGKVDKAMMAIAKAGLVAGAAYFGARGLGRALASSIRLAGEQEQAERQLATAIGHTSRALLAQASAFQKQSEHGDEVIIGMMALASNMGIAEDQLAATTQTAIGLSEAFNLDLNMSMKAAAAAMQGDTQQLTRYIPLLRSTKDEAEKLAIVMSGAERGWLQSIANTETMAGKMNQAKMAIGDAGEVIGGLFAPSVLFAADEIIGLSTAIDGNNERYAEFQSNIYSTAMSLMGTGSAVALVGSLLVGLGSTAMTIGGVVYNAALFMGKGIAGVFTRDFSGAADSLDEMKVHLTAGVMAMDGMLANFDKHGASMTEYFRLMNEGYQGAGAAANEPPPLPLPDISGYEEEMEDLMEDLPMLKLTDEEQAKIEIDIFDEMTRLAAQKHEQWLVDRAEATKMAVGRLAGSLGQLNSATKNSAVASKRLAQTEATIATYLGATKALGQGGMFGWVQFGAILAAGLANVATIEQQKFARGGDFVTSGPQSIMVGDNPGGRERVSVTPLSSPNFDGPQGGGMVINFNAPVTDRAFVRDYIIPEIKRVAS